MRRFLMTALATALVGATFTATSPTATAPAAAAPAVTVTPLWFKVTVGPQNDQVCTIVADQYLPAKASKKKPVPAVLTTNGFGGSKDDQAGISRYLATRGYAVIAYSGLGFGGSSCRITLDDPQVDGKAASQIISYLGGERGRAFLDAGLTKTAPALTVVKRDAKNHLGKKSKNDPRVGMVGVSYGGGAQFAAAAVDPRLDTIIPGGTWNDLSYSLSPNNTSQTSGVSTQNPGAAKLVWALGFTAIGFLEGVSKAQVDQERIVGCPNFVSFVCPAVVTAGPTGAIDPATTAKLRQRSVAGYVKKVRIPTLLFQGQSDTLFNLNEATATFNALRKQKVPVKMAWVNGGHSGPYAPGEIDWAAPNASTQYVTGRIDAWFSRYLKGTKADTGPLFSYYRDWVSYQGNARPAYRHSSTFPVGKSTPFYLSGTTLTPKKSAITAGHQTMLTGPAGAPTSIEKIDAIGSQLPLTVPEIDLPGTAATYTSAPMSKPLDVAGAPTLDLQLSAPITQLTSLLDAGMTVVFVKLYDVAPDGTATHIRDLTAPVRIADTTRPFRATLPAFVHRFNSGHSIRLVVAGGSSNYRGGLVTTPVTIATGSSSQVLRLPVV